MKYFIEVSINGNKTKFISISTNVCYIEQIINSLKIEKFSVIWRYNDKEELTPNDLVHDGDIIIFGNQEDKDKIKVKVVLLGKKQPENVFVNPNSVIKDAIGKAFPDFNINDFILNKGQIRLNDEPVGPETEVSDLDTIILME